MGSQEESALDSYYMNSSEEEDEEEMPVSPRPNSESEEELSIVPQRNNVDVIDLTCDSPEGEELNSDDDSDELPAPGDLRALAVSNPEYLQASTTLEFPPSTSSSSATSSSDSSQQSDDEDDTLEEIKVMKEAVQKFVSSIKNLEKKQKKKAKKRRRSNFQGDPDPDVQSPTPYSNSQREVPNDQERAGCSRDMTVVTHNTSLEKESPPRNEGIQIARVIPTPTTPRAQSPVARRLLESQNEGKELKRKLEFLTMELAESRKCLVKKARTAAVREKMTIDVPEYSMDIYSRVNVNAINYPGNAEGWFRAFNESPDVQGQSDEYHEWITVRVNDLLPKVLQTLLNVWDTVPSHKLAAVDLLNCRKVSKSWKLSVDKYLQENDEENSGCNSVISTVFCSGHTRRILDLVEIVSNPLWLGTQHPFPSRELVIKNFYEDSGNSKAENFKFAIERLLELYGKAVRSFSYVDQYQTSADCENSNRLLLKRWLVLKQWLEKMPNLKTVKLSFIRPASAESSNRLFVHHQFPSFNRLNAIGCQGVPKALIEAMLDANPQIRKLSIHAIPEDRDIQWEDYGDSISVSHFTLNISNIRHLQPLHMVTWPLARISICSDDLIEELNLGMLFQTLETFGSTLTQLSLNLWAWSSPRDKFLRLKLPHLNYFSCSLKDSSPEENISYDFLLSLAALETLEISLERDNEISKPAHQVIQIRGFIDRLYESNIWIVLPRLGRVVASSCFGDDDAPTQFKYVRGTFHHRMPQKAEN